METEQKSATVPNATTDPHASLWRWPRERDEWPSLRDPAAPRRRHLPEGVVDPEELQRMVISHPDDDAPRHAYAAAMCGQAHPFARTIGAFTAAQLRSRPWRRMNG